MDSGFPKRAGFQLFFFCCITDSNRWQDSEFKGETFVHSGIWIPLHGAKCSNSNVWATGSAENVLRAGDSTVK